MNEIIIEINTPLYWSLLLAVYLLGAIPFGLLFSMALSDKDPRDHGSGNIGATNALRTGGKTVGVLTLLADVFKGALPVWFVHQWQGQEVLTATVALAAFIGHVFPVYLKFRGGKGVATMFGVVLPWAPWAGLVAFVLWLIVFFATRYVALASIAAAAIVPVALVLLYQASAVSFWVAVIIAVIIVLRHSDNIIRLFKHEEPKTGGSSS